MFDALYAWLLKNALAAIYLALSVLGGIVAHVREYESLNPQMTRRQHAVAILRRSVMALLAGLLWFFIMQENGWESRPYAYVGASLVGLFAPEFFDLLWSLAKKRIAAPEAK